MNLGVGLFDEGDGSLCSQVIFEHGAYTRKVLVHHHHVGVDQAFDQGGGESVAFHINAGFVADFAIIEIKLKVANDRALVGAGEEFGDHTDVGWIER